MWPRRARYRERGSVRMRSRKNASPHPSLTTPAPWPSHCEGPCLKVHRMQLAVSPCQDEGILLQRKGRWDQQSMSNQDSDGEGSKYGPRTRQSKALVIKGSDLGNKKQSIDLRHFQAGPRRGKVEVSSGEAAPAPPCALCSHGSGSPVWGLMSPQLLTALCGGKQWVTSKGLSGARCPSACTPALYFLPS